MMSIDSRCHVVGYWLPWCEAPGWTGLTGAFAQDLREVSHRSGMIDVLRTWWSKSEGMYSVWWVRLNLVGESSYIK